MKDMKFKATRTHTFLLIGLTLAGCQKSGADLIRTSIETRSPVALTYMVDQAGLCYAGFTNVHVSTKADDVTTVAAVACTDKVKAAAASRKTVAMLYFKDQLGLCYAGLVNRAQNTAADDVVAIAAVPCSEVGAAE
jgi:hypothetical protein